MTSDDSNFVEDFEKDIILAYELLDGYTNIFIRIETLGDNFVKEFGDNFELYCEVLNSFINKTKKCIMNINNCEKQNEESQKSKKESEKLERQKCEKIQISEVMYDNISERFSKLEITSRTDVSKLTDQEIHNYQK